jgi:hypothetical protein
MIRSLFLAALLTLPAIAAEILVADLRGSGDEMKLAAITAQGIANRTGPRVFLIFGEECRWLRRDFESGAKNGVGRIWSETSAKENAARFPLMEDAWLTILREEGHRLQPVTPVELLAITRPLWKGFLLYQKFGEDLAPAATWAGIEDLVPVTKNLLDKLGTAGMDTPVLADYTKVRAAFPSGSHPRLAGHRYLIDTLLPRCRRDGAVSRDRTYGLAEHDTILCADIAIQNRWPVYDLSHVAHANKAANFPKENAEPPDKPLLDELLGKLEPYSEVHGWGRNGEEAFIRSLNRNRLLGMVSGVPNTSLFARLPTPACEFRQKRPDVDPATVHVEDKIYLAFMVNEGDTIKNAATFMGFGSWLQPERGSVPINWGIMPSLLVSQPWLMRYYYRTMTDKDYFFAAPSGWGYAHPASLPAADLMPYASLIRRGMIMADVRHLNIWWLRDIRDDSVRSGFLHATGAAGHIEWSGLQAVEYPENAPVNIRSNHFYTYKQPAADFARLLIHDMKDVNAPWFIGVYGAMEHGTPHRFQELAKHLPQDRFKIVQLDEFFTAATKARGQMKGRVWKPGPGAPKGVAP